MKKSKTLKIIAVLLCIFLTLQQTGFAQVASVELNVAGHLASLRNSLPADKIRPLHLRSISCNNPDGSFKLILDNGNGRIPDKRKVESTTQDLLNYFFVGIALPNNAFWVNLRPDSPDDIIDPLLAQTEVGRIFLESDLQLKKDVADAMNPQTPEGRKYWDKVYQKAGQIYESQNVTIPTLTRPWIVPDEIIIGESAGSAYVYKATLKVMLEQDYLKDSNVYSFKDEREKQLNEYSSQIIREEILPKLTKSINNSNHYAALRQVYYSLILAQWFKARNRGKNNQYSRLIDSRDLSNLQSKVSYSADTYFKAYKDNFEKGEFNAKEPVYTPYGQVIRSYFSGGIEGVAPAIPNFGDKTLGPVTMVPNDKDTGESANAALVGENVVVDGNLGLEVSLIQDSKQEDDAAEETDSAESRAVERINARISEYNMFQQSIGEIAAKLEKGEMVSDQDIVVLEDLKSRIILTNSLVAMDLKVHQGDILVVNNQASIKFLNTILGESQVDMFIDLRQAIATELLLSAGLISSAEDNTLSLLFKQDKFVIEAEIVDSLGQAEVLKRLEWVAKSLTAELTKDLHDEYRNNKTIQNYTFLFNFGVSNPVKDSSDNAKILADIQALQAAKMGRRFGSQNSMFDQREFDVLVFQADKIRQELGLAPGELPSEDSMKEVRAKTEEGLELEVKNGVKNAQRQLLIKKYLDIIDLFDYPKYWRADLARRTEEKERLLRILKGLDIIMSRAPPFSPATAVDILWEAQAVIGTNPKNHRISSGEEFLANASALYLEEDGRLIAVDVIGFWADIQKNLAQAHQGYMEKIDLDNAEKEKAVLDLCIGADDSIKRKMSDKLKSFVGLLGRYIPVVKHSKNKRFLINQEGGDEIVFYIHGQYNWDVLASKLSRRNLGVRITAVRIGDDDFGGAYVVAQQSDNKVKALEALGVMSAVVSLEINDQGVSEWFVHYQDKRTPYDTFYRELEEKNKGSGGMGSDSGSSFGQQTEIIFSGEEITKDLAVLNNTASEVLLGPEEDFKEKIFLLFGIQAGGNYQIKRIIPVSKYTEQKYGYVETDPAEIVRLIDGYATEGSKLLGVLHTHPYDVTKILTKPGPSWQDGLGEDLLPPERSGKITEVPIGVVLEGTIPEGFSMDDFEEANLSAGIKAYFYLTEEGRAKVFKVVDFAEWLNQPQPGNNDKGNNSGGGMGGIDFRLLPIVAVSLNNLKANMKAMPRASLQRINLNQEKADIERLVNVGIPPSKERLREYFSASLLRGNFKRDRARLISCLSDIFRMEEESGSLSDPLLKDILVVLSSGKSI
ncbi:MAG: hypothetical protein WC431_04970 [Candidatus Omnitrophota bacterium]